MCGALRLAANPPEPVGKTGSWGGSDVAAESANKPARTGRRGAGGGARGAADQFGGGAGGPGGGARGQADHDRLQHGLDRRARGQRHLGALGDADLGRRHQQKGRPAGPAGQARLLRRPKQSGAGSRHLYEDPRRRQGRSGGFRLCHQYRGAGDAGGDRPQHDLHRAIRARHQRGVPIPEILLDAAGRPRPAPGDLGRVFRHRQGRAAKARAEDDRARGR